MTQQLKPQNQFYQPPRNGRVCMHPDCNVRISSVNKTGLCRRHAAQQVGRRTGGWNKGRKWTRTKQGVKFIEA